MRHRIWNRTTQKWVKNDDGDVCEYDNYGDAADALMRLFDLRKVNPEHANDLFEVVTIQR